MNEVFYQGTGGGGGEQSGEGGGPIDNIVMDRKSDAVEPSHTAAREERHSSHKKTENRVVHDRAVHDDKYHAPDINHHSMSNDEKSLRSDASDEEILAYVCKDAPSF
jgi:hypothetical protein